MPEIKSLETEETVTMQSTSAGYSSAMSASSSTRGVATGNNYLSKAEIEDLREAFRLFDVDGKGVISFQELKEVADALALENGNKENALSTHSFRHLSDLLNNVQNSGDDGDSGNSDDGMEIDEDGFIRLMHFTPPSDDSRDEYQRVFDLFDTKGKGYISVADLRAISEDLGETMTDEELDEMISKASPTTGKVTPEDFQRVMTKRLFS